MVIAWLVLGVVLLLFEAHHWAFYALFGAIGALAAALVAVVAPGAIALQAGVAIGLSTVGVVGARPFVSRIVHSHRGGLVSPGVHGGLVGQQVVTLDQVGDAHHVGHVRLAGERWLAVSGNGDLLAAHTPVLVTAVEGTTLVVWPVEGLREGN
ncbi:MAG TPA: NfeD family protein [Acidimicrobiales bacterium]|nr:NfeD family protein [Acidimicrobiales bacterium]